MIDLCRAHLVQDRERAVLLMDSRLPMLAVDEEPEHCGGVLDIALAGAFSTDAGEYDRGSTLLAVALVLPPGPVPRA